MFWGHLEAKTQCPVGQLRLKNVGSVPSYYRDSGYRGCMRHSLWLEASWQSRHKGKLLSFVVFVLWQQKLKWKPTEQLPRPMSPEAQLNGEVFTWDLTVYYVFSKCSPKWMATLLLPIAPLSMETWTAPCRKRGTEIFLQAGEIIGFSYSLLWCLSLMQENE